MYGKYISPKQVVSGVTRPRRIGAIAPPRAPRGGQDVLLFQDLQPTIQPGLPSDELTKWRKGEPGQHKVHQSTSKYQTS